MVKRVLMIAYHYPPVRGSSGVQRTLKFTRYLDDHGWEPIVLTAHPRAYPQTGTDQMHEIPAHITVKRAFALDTYKHLSWQGAYPGFLAWPDRWISWWLAAVPGGLNLIRRYKPAVIWSTFPIATAHLIGLTLARLSGLPWVADFRDSMTEEVYPPDPKLRRMFRWIESRTVARAAHAVFTTPGALRMYAERYPHVPASKWQMIANGYDEENFELVRNASNQRRASSGRTTLLHSGLLYPSERDPTAFFDALTEMKAAGEISAETLRVTLRASGYEDYYRPALETRGIDDIVSLETPIAYAAALAEMLSADGLLIFQASNCNHQIPAKLYEYLRARRPIMALTDAAGDTAATLMECGIDTIASLRNVGEIKRVLSLFLQQIQMQSARIVGDEIVSGYSRRAQAAELARLLDSVSSGEGARQRTKRGGHGGARHRGL